MANPKKGDVARTMAAAPLTSTVGESRTGESLIQQIANGNAPDAIMDAARESNANATPANIIAATLGTNVHFRPPTSGWNRTQKDGSIKRLMANAVLIGDVITLEFGVFCTEKEESDAEGKFMDQQYTIMLPRGFNAHTDHEAALEDWKYQILKQYDEWAAANRSKNGVVAVAPSGARLVKKVRVPAPAPVQK